MTAKIIHTVKGPVEIDSLGLILPHEHLFTDLRGPHVPEYAQGDPSAVLEVVEPYLAEAAAAGATALVECSTIGVGRNLAVLQALANATSIHIVAPTGVYRDAFIPTSLRDVGEDHLADLWTKELTEGMELALVGQNLWEPRHAEFRSASFPIDPYIERSVYLRLTWRR